MKIYYDFTKTNKQLIQVMIVFIVLYIGTILIISLVLYLSLSHFIIKPVLILKNAMEKLDNKTLGVKVDFSARDEIGAALTAAAARDDFFRKSRRETLSVIVTPSFYSKTC